MRKWWKITGSFPKAHKILLGSGEAVVFADKSGEFKKIGDSMSVEIAGKTERFKMVGILDPTGSKDDFSTSTAIETAHLQK